MRKLYFITIFVLISQLHSVFVKQHREVLSNYMHDHADWGEDIEPEHGMSE